MKTIIFKNEIEFREFIINSQEEIIKTIIFEDPPDNIIYFYCFTANHIIATKELKKEYQYYANIYKELNSILNLNINQKNKVLILNKQKDSNN